MNDETETAMTDGASDRVVDRKESYCYPQINRKWTLRPQTVALVKKQVL